MAMIMALAVAIGCWMRRGCWKWQAQLPIGAHGWPIIGETIEFVSRAYSSRPESFMEKRRDMLVSNKPLLSNKISVQVD